MYIYIYYIIAHVHVHILDHLFSSQFLFIYFGLALRVAVTCMDPSIHAPQLRAATAELRLFMRKKSYRPVINAYRVLPTLGLRLGFEKPLRRQ